MKGFIYKFGASLKDFGKRAGHKRRFYAGAVIRIGLAVRDSVRGCPVGELR